MTPENRFRLFHCLAYIPMIAVGLLVAFQKISVLWIFAAMACWVAGIYFRIIEPQSWFPENRTIKEDTKRGFFRPWFVVLLMLGSTAQAADYTVVVFDASGSMSNGLSGSRDNKMVVAKRALTKAVDKIPANSNFGIVVFEAGRDEPWIYPLAPFDRGKVLQAIQKPQPGGGTPLGDYMKIGADVLLKTRQDNHNQGTYRLIVVTDGEADDVSLVTLFNDDIRSRGIVVNVIGVGMAADHSLAKKVDFYQNAADETSLAKALNKVLAETPDDKERNSDFLEGTFDPKVALVILEHLSMFHNQPIGEAPPIKQVDSAGNVTTTPGPLLIKTEDGTASGWIIGGIVCLLLVVGAGAAIGKQNS